MTGLGRVGVGLGKGHVVCSECVKVGLGGLVGRDHMMDGVDGAGGRGVCDVMGGMGGLGGLGVISVVGVVGVGKVELW